MLYTYLGCRSTLRVPLLYGLHDSDTVPLPYEGEDSDKPDTAQDEEDDQFVDLERVDVRQHGVWGQMATSEIIILFKKKD